MTDSVGQLGVVIVAAGQSSRMGGIDKQVAELGGDPVISHSLRVFENLEVVSNIVLVMSKDNLTQGESAVRAGGFSKVSAVVAGGARRQDSVKIGLDLLADDSGSAPEFVAIHDGARPFVDEEMIERGLTAAKKIGAAIAGVPVKDTIKTAPHRVVTSTPDRSEMWAIQTPQIFRFDVLKTAHEMTDEDVTDDASMVESVGGLVAIFTGSNDNIKITTPEDLELASLILKRRSTALTSGGGGVPTEGSKFGVGFDGHGFVAGGPLRLGGVDIDFDQKLDGHSDGDVLLHAIASSILGAAGLGDLGGRFPSSDERYAGFDSAQFIAESARLAAQSGWLVSHVDATIIAQKPRLASEAPKMASVISSIKGLEQSSINVKITSTDHVGAIGAGEGIAAHAIATLIPTTA